MACFGLIAQLVEYCAGITEYVGSDSVEVSSLRNYLSCGHNCNGFPFIKINCICCCVLLLQTSDCSHLFQCASSAGVLEQRKAKGKALEGNHSRQRIWSAVEDFTPIEFSGICF